MNRQQVIFEAINKIDKSKVVKENTTGELWGKSVIHESIGALLVTLGIISLVTASIYKWTKFLEKLNIQLQDAIERLLITKLAEESGRIVQKEFKGSKNLSLYKSLYFCKLYSTTAKVLLSGTYFSKMVNLFVTSGIIKGAIASSALKSYFTGISQELDANYKKIKTDLTTSKENDRQDRIGIAEVSADIQRLELMVNTRAAKLMAEHFMSELPAFLEEEI